MKYNRSKQVDYIHYNTIILCNFFVVKLCYKEPGVYFITKSIFMNSGDFFKINEFMIDRLNTKLKILDVYNLKKMWKIN